jgi:hypothetical protein
LIDVRIRMLHNIFLIAGLCVLFGGFVSWYGTRNFLARCVKTKGVAVSHQYQTSQDEDGKTTTSFPMIRFIHPISGMEYTVRSNVSGSMRERQEVEILYDPDNPKNAKINKLSHTWMIPIIVTLMGVFFSFVGVLARINVNGIVGIFDKIIVVFLVIVLVLSLTKLFTVKRTIPNYTELN